MVIAGAPDRLNEPLPELGVLEAMLAGLEMLAHLVHALVVQLFIQIIPELADGGLAVDGGDFRHSCAHPWWIEGLRPLRALAIAAASVAAP